METKFSDGVRHQDVQIETARTYFADSCSKLDNQISDQTQKSYGMVQDRMAKVCGPPTAWTVTPTRWP